MPKIFDGNKKDRRVVLSLTPDQHARLVALADIEGKPAAVIVRELMESYMQTRAADIDKALKADAVYQESLKEIRRNI